MGKFIFLIIIFITTTTISEEYTWEQTFIVDNLGEIVITDSSKFNIFSLKGHWTDNFGNFGKIKCFGSRSVIGETLLSLDSVCEREAKEGFFIWTKGSRDETALQAGVGKTKIIAATGKWEALVGTDCKYAVSLFRDSARVKAICNISKNLYNLLNEG